MRRVSPFFLNFLENLVVGPQVPQPASFANPCVLAAGDSRRIVKIGGRLLGGMLFGVGGAGDGAGALSQDGQKGQGAVRMIERAGDGAGAWGSHCKTKGNQFCEFGLCGSGAVSVALRMLLRALC